MKAKAIVPFFDKVAEVTRSMGEEFECSDARFKEINSTEFGILAEAVEFDEPAEPAQSEPVKHARRTRKAKKDN